MSTKLEFKIILQAIRVSSDQNQPDSSSTPIPLEEIVEDMEKLRDDLTKIQDLVIKWNNKAKKDRENNDIIHASVRVDNCLFAVRDTFEFQEVIVIDAWVDDTQSQFHSLLEVQEGEFGAHPTEKTFYRWLEKECKHSFHLNMV